ncbi:hypothetical protein F5Y09DRAFT_352859 [Xylaria sp. FL1042]|nr:hypothetical protein F5Y09DRAFT_352859 [Xylaria sp. FL1042]
MVLANQPQSMAFGYCGGLGLEVKHVNSDLSLTPFLLLQFLPPSWGIVGAEGISNTASRDLLLRSYRGIVIPLFMEGGWTLFCYTNPVYLDNDQHLLWFVDPTKSGSRYHAALKMLDGWIPKNQLWSPNGLKLELVKEIKSQLATEEDSGIHVIHEAIALARTGKLEPRTLNEQVCKGLRIKYFVQLLNELQEVVNKEAQKNKQGT